MKFNIVHEEDLFLKQPKKLTRDQKLFLEKKGLDSREWMLVEDKGSYLVVTPKKSPKPDSCREVHR